MELTIDNKLIASIKSKKKLTIQKGEAHMNQIIYNMHRKNRKTANSTFFKFFFSFCIITLVFFIFWFLYKFYKTGQNDVISQKLIASYSISTLFSNSTSYETELQTESEPFVIRNY